ncbi:MAG: tyrosine-type recombinase/integrase [Clostridiaceae bacterium]
MNDLLNNYITHLKNNNTSYNTIEAYRRDILDFFSYLSMNGFDFREVDTNVYMTYCEYLYSNDKSQNTVIRNLISVRIFYKYLYSKGFIENDSISLYHIPKRETTKLDILTIEEIKRLLDSPNTNSNKGIRDKAILELLYATGMKVYELINLKISDINIKYSYVRCIDLNLRERINPIGEEAIWSINKYLVVREKININKNDILFLNLRGNKMSRQGLWKIIKIYGDQCFNDKRINSYTLRNSFAFHLLENGADAKSVQDLLGYKDIANLNKYVKVVSKKRIVDVYKNTHPRV